MGRPRKIDLNKRVTKDKDGRIIKNASKATYDKCYKICEMYGKGKAGIEECCKTNGWSTTMFYRCVREYGNCKTVANSVGIGLRNDAEIRPAKLQAPKAKKDAYTIFDLPCRKDWTDELKQEAIRETIDGLKIGMPFAHAVCYSGANMQLLKEWVKEEPGILDAFKKAESQWTRFFFKCLTRAADVASQKGKFGEIIMGAERKYHDDWGKIQSIDIITKTEHEQEKQLRLTSEQAKSVGAEDADFDIVEVKSDRKKAKKES